MTSSNSMCVFNCTFYSHHIFGILRRHIWIGCFLSGDLVDHYNHSDMSRYCAPRVCSLTLLYTLHYVSALYVLSCEVALASRLFFYTLSMLRPTFDPFFDGLVRCLPNYIIPSLYPSATNKNDGAGWRKSRGVDLRHHFCSHWTPNYIIPPLLTNKRDGAGWRKSCDADLRHHFCRSFAVSKGSEWWRKFPCHVVRKNKSCRSTYLNRINFPLHKSRFGGKVAA